MKNDKTQDLLAKIKIAETNLYVFKDSSEKNRWLGLLNEAERSLKQNPSERYLYAQDLLAKVNTVIDNAWKRINRWYEFQKKVTIASIITIIVEILIVSIYYKTVNLSNNGFYTSLLFGLLGGTLGVALNLGKDLVVNQSNRLQILRLILRPLIGAIAALLVYILLKLNIITIATTLNQDYVLIALSILAGYSERFLTKTLDSYLPKILDKTI